ncbi:MAG: hypothetical protein JSW40_00550 [Candidatus Omnitrophota bacterium]|nr:MAG: hypothetical protein JSW40_00550 [Candidatus Omnitrophota bacterium]
MRSEITVVNNINVHLALRLSVVDDYNANPPEKIKYSLIDSCMVLYVAQELLEYMGKEIR